MFEISAKRLDVFRCVVSSTSLYFRNPGLRLHQVAYTHCERGAAHYILEIAHILLTLQGTKENLEARISRRES